MKTLHPVDKATYEKIGAAYAICAEYPEIFGNVTLEKFCSMFVDVIPEGKDKRDARMKAYAPEMYRLLQNAFISMVNAGIDKPLCLKINECLCHIVEESCPTNEEADDE